MHFRKERGVTVGKLTVGKPASKKSVARSAPAGRNGRSSAKPAAKPVARQVAAAKGMRPTAKAGTQQAAAKGKPAAKPMVTTKPAVATKPAAAAANGKPANGKPVAASPAKPAVTAAASAKPVIALKPAALPAAAAEVRKDARASRAQKPVRVEPGKPEATLRPIQLMEQASSSGDNKPKKNQAGLTVKELEFFRDLLLAKRRELVGDMSSMEREALQSGDHGLSSLPMHMADMGTDNYEQEFTLGLVEKDRNLLREINHALAKIQNGSYGICEGNGKPIAKVRLEAQPWAKYSIEYARLQEKGPIRR